MLYAQVENVHKYRADSSNHVQAMAQAMQIANENSRKVLKQLGIVLADR